MYAVERLGSYITRGVYSVSGPFHPFGGAVDIVAVEQQDGSFKSSPWYVRFGKFQGVLKAKEKVVNVSVNGVEANFHMCLNHKGEAYFLREVDVQEGESVPLSLSSGDEADAQPNNDKPPLKSRSYNFDALNSVEKVDVKNDRQPLKSKSYNFDASTSNSVGKIDVKNGKVMSRTSSRRSRILGLVFGRRSMKEEVYQEGESGNGVERADSMERAEIAANLLELKWSTNLAIKKPRKDIADKYVQIADEKGEVSSSKHGNVENSLDQGALHKETVSHIEQVGGSSPSAFENLQIVEETRTEVLRIGAPEQVSEFMAGESVLEGKCEMMSSMSQKIDIGDTEHDENEKVQYSIELEEYPGKHIDEEQAFHARDILPGCGISQEVSETDKVNSCIYCETSERSIVAMDGSGEHTHETVYLASEGHGEVCVHTEMLRSATELLLEDTVNIKVAEDDDLQTEPVEVPENYSPPTSPFCSCVPKSNVVDREEPLAPPDFYSQMVSMDPTLGSVDEAESKGACIISGFSNLAPETQDNENKKEEEITSKFQASLESVCDYIMTEAIPILPSGSSEEEHFLFSDLDGISKMQFVKSISPEQVDKESCSISPGFINEANVPLNERYELSSSSDNCFEENSLSDLENSIEKLRVMSHPIIVPGTHKVSARKVGQLVESLPNLGYRPEHDIDHPLSQSQGASSKVLNLKWQTGDSSCIKSDRYQEMALEQPNIEDTLTAPEHMVDLEENPSTDLENLVEKLRITSNPIIIPRTNKLSVEEVGRLVESLPNLWSCPENLDAQDTVHPLSHSLDSSLKPMDVKGDSSSINLVKDPQLALEQPNNKDTQILGKPKKVLPNPALGDPSKASLASGGSWRIWPFSSRRSSSKNGMQLVLNDARASEAENASESSVGMDGSNTVPKPKPEKMMKAMTPTSEQLASLNLKEGKNIVTFTFSTAMLGQQQVDARIYLWKWNTRIVISDVDGTITKSDVLGQFMPLVGIDWSQTGVAHLFTAIKENGYQLLFLSARAISQAYHTRQFLFNLKQDGKALPEGPVVISPDGLFPSLYREVIRRAPHEFKISCLEAIRALFPSDCNPFYAGFGNRDTDEFSYLKVGIPKGKIFIINPKGEVAVNRRVDTRSYSSLHALVNGMFPPTTSSEQEDFNSWNYWKLPPPAFCV